MSAARSPIELQILGRVLLHAALVGAAAGLLGSLFFAGVEAAQRLCLERWAGYRPLRAGGERIFGEMETLPPFRPCLLVTIPPLVAPPARPLSLWLAPSP